MSLKCPVYTDQTSKVANMNDTHFLKSQKIKRSNKNVKNHYIVFLYVH